MTHVCPNGRAHVRLSVYASRRTYVVMHVSVYVPTSQNTVVRTFEHVCRKQYVHNQRNKIRTYKPMIFITLFALETCFRIKY